MVAKAINNVQQINKNLTTAGIEFLERKKSNLKRKNKMAKIQEEIVVIRLSKLVKDNSDANQLTDTDFSQNVEALVQELVGDSVVVEVVKE